MWDNVTEIKLKILGRVYGSKIQKVSRCRPAVSNETIPVTRQGFLFTKVAPVESITDIVLLDFWLMLLSWMFISSYTTILSALLNVYFILHYHFIFFSGYDIRMSLYDFWLINGPSIKYVHNWREVSSKMWTVAYRGRRCHVRTCTVSFHFLALSYIVTCFICRNLTLTFFVKKGCVLQKPLFLNMTVWWGSMSRRGRSRGGEREHWWATFIW